jgi:predicted lipid-binding transport protein (Tim44 family)
MFVLFFIFLTFFLLVKLSDVLGLRMGFHIKKDDLRDFSNQNVPQETVASEIDKSFLQFKKLYPSFDAVDFLQKAQKAFEIIFHAYSKGDVKTLKSLLSPRIFYAFSMAIEDRKKRGEILEGILVRFIHSEITDVSNTDDDLLVTVKFETEQSNVLKLKDGTILEGNADFVENRTEIWSFSRKKTSSDARWYLHEIKS